MFAKYNFLFVLLSVVISKYAEACNGYALKLNHVKTCVDNSIVVPQNIDVTLDKDCNMVLSGCIEYTKAFKTAKGNYEINKPPMPQLSGEFDYCDAIGNTKLLFLSQAIASFGMPKKCPIPAKKYCLSGKKTINMSAYKAQLAMAVGQTSAKLYLDHDTGKSCIDVSVKLSKKK